jgi:proteasome activator subunit 4
MIGELTSVERTESRPKMQVEETDAQIRKKMKIPSFKLGSIGSHLESTESVEEFPRLENDEEDALLRDTTASFADWVTSFIRRVIILLENLPEEGANGAATGGASEGTKTTSMRSCTLLTSISIAQIIDAVTGACSQICVHLSEPLYDLVLNMVSHFFSPP